MRIIADKIASVTKNVPLKHTIEMTDTIISAEGYLLAVQALQDKKVYNQLELTSGRLSTIHKGDILVVALGNRRALKGFVGEVPKQLKKNDIIHLLNLGGVAGICTSANTSEVGRPLKVQVLGAVCDNKKIQLNIQQGRFFSAAPGILGNVPLIVVSGTSMNVGKTSVACEIVKGAFRKGHTVMCAKMAGIAALKDTLNMQDYGAKKTVSMIDAGYTSTVNNNLESIAVTKGAINYLTRYNPDYILIELGDGILGEYGVLEILKDQEFQNHIQAHIGCAYDPVGALKFVEICKKTKIPLHVISGPVTDNSVGIQFIQNRLHLAGLNALSQKENFFSYLQKICLKNKKL